MDKKLCVLFGVLLLQACGTLAYTPTEYPLRDGLVPAFDVAGTVSVKNTQPSTEPYIVYSYGGTKLSSNLNAITETMVQQTQREIKKNGRTGKAGSPKTIELRVDSLLSNYIAFFWKSNIKFQAKLGNGEVVTKTVPHSSGDVRQDLNGCIAEGVMQLLTDEKVKAYLGR